LPLELLIVGASIAQEAPELDNGKASEDWGPQPDLVFGEDSQLALAGRFGKAIVGSCQHEDPLWVGKIAIKNISGATVGVDPASPSGVEIARREREGWPLVRAYVPNNIDFQAEGRLEHDLGEFAQELVKLSIGRNQNKCRNYDAPPVFDERLSGRPGPLYQSTAQTAAPADILGRQIRMIQTALIKKGYRLPSGANGDYGTETIEALKIFYKDQSEPQPPRMDLTPPSPNTVRILLGSLGIGSPSPTASGGSGSDECIRGINLVPVYLEIDPQRHIPEENRSNNKVQIMVAIDCSNIAR